MKVPQNKPKSDPVPIGTYPAICYAVVDWGTHLKKSDKFGDKEERQLRLQWEIPGIRIKYTKDDKEMEGPKVIGKTYKFSTYKKSALFAHLTAWGLSSLDNLDFKTLLGRSCSINIAQFEAEDKSVISYIQAIMQREAGSSPIQGENPQIYYSIEENGLNIPDGMYEFMANKIKESPEYKLMESPPIREDGSPPPQDTTDYNNLDDVPF
jgi:hypothetical protein